MHSDSGSIYTRQSNLPKSTEFSIPRDPPSNQIHIDASKFLVRKEVFPDAGRVTSCLSLSWYEEPRLSELKSVILLSALHSPGNYVRGVKEFPQTRELIISFWATAGFDFSTVAMLVEHLPVESSEDLVEAQTSVSENSSP